MFALRKRESSNGPFIGGELPISTQILNKNSWIAETTRCQGARVLTLARLRAASAPPASPRLLTAAGAPRLASSCLRPPSREARSTFRRKRVRTLGGSVGLCCHGPLTFEGQGGVAGNTTWTVGVRKPRACCQTQRQIPPCERASRRPVAAVLAAGFLPVLHAARHTPLRPCALAVPHDLCPSGQRTVPVWGLSHWTVLAAVCL